MSAENEQRVESAEEKRLREARAAGEKYIQDRARNRQTGNRWAWRRKLRAKGLIK